MTTAEGKFVGKALLVVQGAVEVERSVISAPANKEEYATIIGTTCRTGVRNVTHRFAPGKCGGEGEAVGEALIQLGL